jgi:hypothetical protein
MILLLFDRLWTMAPRPPATSPATATTRMPKGRGPKRWGEVYLRTAEGTTERFPEL